MKAKKHLERIARYDVPHVDRLRQVRLDRNERASHWKQETWLEIQKIISPDLIMSYPELGPVYEKLAGVLNVKTEELLLSHGSDVGLKSIFEAYAGAGDETVSLTPSYAMYPIYAGMVGATPVEVGFESDLSLPFKAILDSITDRTRIVILPNPNQPIERVFTKSELEEILKLANERDFILVVDEAYHYFYPETAISYINTNPSLIVTRTFSKAFGMAGLRAGVLISNEKTISEIKKVKPISEINGVAAGLIEFFLDRMDIVKSYVDEVNLGRQFVVDWGKEQGILVRGKTGNSVLLELRDAEQVKKTVSEARQKGYLIKGPFPYPATRHLRITLDSKDIMKRVLEVIGRSIGD